MGIDLQLQLSEDAEGIPDIQPGLVTGPVLFAAEECPEVLPIIQRNFSLPGDTEMVREDLHLVTVCLLMKMFFY